MSVRDITDAMLAMGEVQARRATANGAVWGNVARSLGAIPGQIREERERQGELDLKRRNIQSEIDERIAQGKERDAITAANTLKQHGERVGQLFAGIASAPDDQTAAELWNTGIPALVKDGTLDERDLSMMPKQFPGRTWAKSAYVARVKPTLDTLHAMFPEPQAPKTREIEIRNADGSTTKQIVPDTPGQTFTSAPAPKDPKTYQVTVQGPNGEPVTRLATEDEMKTGVPTYRAPTAAEKKIGDLTSDAVDQAAARYRLLGPSSIPTRIEEPDRVAIMNKAAEQDKLLGNSPAASVQKMAAYKADATALTKMRTMSSAAEAFETKALAQANLIDTLSAKTGRTDYPIVNKLVLSGKIATGNTNAQLLANAIIGFQSEYAKILEGSTGSVAAVGEGSAARAQQMVSAALSKGTLKDTIAQMRWEMRQTMNGYGEVIDHITNRMGGTPPPAQTTPPPPVAPPPTHRYNPATGKAEAVAP